MTMRWPAAGTIDLALAVFPSRISRMPPLFSSQSGEGEIEKLETPDLAAAVTMAGVDERPRMISPAHEDEFTADD
jgi:hypothetical protein